MRKLLAPIVTAAALAAAPAQALVFAGFTSTNPNASIDVLTVGPDLAAFDLQLPGNSDSVISFRVEEGDSDTIAFNSFIEFLSPVSSINLTPDFATLFIGTITPAFSDFTLSAEDNNALIRFRPYEFVSLALGDVGDGGTNFALSLSAEPGDIVSLFITTVPAPAAFALFGLGALGLAVVRRR